MVLYAALHLQVREKGGEQLCTAPNKETKERVLKQKPEQRYRGKEEKERLRKKRKSNCNSGSKKTDLYKGVKTGARRGA